MSDLLFDNNDAICRKTSARARLKTYTLKSPAKVKRILRLDINDEWTNEKDICAILSGKHIPPTSKLLIDLSKTKTEGKQASFSLQSCY